MIHTDRFEQKWFSEYCRVIHDITGITIRPERSAMVEGRVRRRVNALNIAGYGHYLEHMLSCNDETQQFINCITTNETYFYRTPSVWRYLENSYIPEWQAQNSGKKFKAWSAAASTGAEAHTLAMVLQSFKQKCPDFTYQISGTDISSEVIETARTAIYPEKKIVRMRGEMPEYINHFMELTAENNYRVVDELRFCVNFKTANIFDKNARTNQVAGEGAGIYANAGVSGGASAGASAAAQAAARFVENPAVEKFDLILMRNILIYFNHEDQKRAVAAVTRHLGESARLVIGESESLNGLDDSIGDDLRDRADHGLSHGNGLRSSSGDSLNDSLDVELVNRFERVIPFVYQLRSGEKA